MRRIDLLSDILSPVLFALINNLSTTYAIAFVVTWNTLSVIPEYLILRVVYQRVPTLARKGWEKAQTDDVAEADGEGERLGDREVNRKEEKIGITRMKRDDEEEVRSH
jgi:hypothetical protein